MYGMEINLKTLYIAIYTKQHNISKYIYKIHIQNTYTKYIILKKMTKNTL